MIERIKGGNEVERDVSVEEIRSIFAEGRRKEAQLLAETRLKSVERALQDIQDTLEKGEGEISKEQWETEQRHLIQEAEELEQLLKSIKE